MKAWRIAVPVVLVLAAASWWFWNKREPEPKWRTERVELGPIQVSVTATGTLQAVVQVQIGTQVSGTISALYADFNSHVKKGQVIARLDTTLLAAALQDVRSNQARVEAQNKQAAADLKRSQALFDRSLISQAELDQSVAAAHVAAANMSSARAQVDRARINLRYATITSPIDGMVLSRAVDVGQTVASSFNTPTLFTIAGDLRQMQVQAAVDEADIGKIQVDQPATFTVDAYPDSVFRGEVEQVRLQPKTEQNVVTYDVVIRVPNPALRLMPGMTANLTIAVMHKDQALLVPAAALRFQPPRDKRGRGEGRGRREPGSENRGAAGSAGSDSGAGADSSGAGRRGGKGRIKGARIFLLEAGKLRPVPVQAGLSDGARTEITGPVEPGAEVVVGMDNAAAAGAQPGARPFGLPSGGGGRGRF